MSGACHALDSSHIKMGTVVRLCHKLQVWITAEEENEYSNYYDNHEETADSSKEIDYHEETADSSKEIDYHEETVDSSKEKDITDDTETRLVKNPIYYLTHKTYPIGATKNEKRSIRRRAEAFVERNGEVLYRKPDKSLVCYFTLVYGILFKNFKYFFCLLGQIHT